MSKPKINVKHTFNDNLCLKTTLSDPYMENIEMFELENQESSNQDRKIEIGIIEAEIRIEATLLTKKIVTAPLPSTML